MAIVRQCKITNHYGFHIRPTQRFSQLAKAFACDVTVTVGDKSAPGKSIFHLMGLKGKSGLDMQIETAGSDEGQAMNCLAYLVDNQFFVEDEFGQTLPRTRHFERLASFAGFFESRIEGTFNGQKADATRIEAVTGLDFKPWEKPEFTIDGPDADQARSVLDTLLKYNFFCEEDFSVEENKLSYMTE